MSPQIMMEYLSMVLAHVMKKNGIEKFDFSFDDVQEAAKYGILLKSRDGEADTDSRVIVVELVANPTHPENQLPLGQMLN